MSVLAFRPNSPHARDVASMVHPQTNLRLHETTGPTIVSRGDGVHVVDEEGRRFFDSTAGLWCASLGFNVERLAKVAHEQMRTLGYYHTYRHSSNSSSIDLAERLLAIAPVPMSKVLFQCSGSEANDVAIKLTWYYQNAVGQPGKTKVIGRRMGYHGSTIAAVSASGKADMHADFNLPLPMFRHTDTPHYYRGHDDGESEEAYSERLAASLERLILEEGPETVGAFIAEPAMGAAGAISPPRGYFDRIQAVLDRYDVLFIADEVICGFGRTGSMWGSETYGARPDIVTCAKALSGAHLPISAVLVNARVYEAMLSESDKQGAFAHGFTYSGHPVTTAVALETLRIYEEMDIVGRVRELAPVFQGRLRAFLDHPLVGDVRGDGLFAGLELMADKATRRPFDPALEVGSRVGRHARANGLIQRVVGDRLAFAPPLVINEAHVDELGTKLGAALDATLEELSELDAHAGQG